MEIFVVYADESFWHNFLSLDVSITSCELIEWVVCLHDAIKSLYIVQKREGRKVFTAMIPDGKI